MNKAATASRDSQHFRMTDVKRLAIGTAVAGSLGLAALGLGAGVANAAPPNTASGSAWALDPGWGRGPGGPGWDNRGGGWNGGGPNLGPPPPPPYYGNDGYNNFGGGGGGCVTGPFGLLHFCP